MSLIVDTQHGRDHSGDIADTLRRMIVPASTVEEYQLDSADVLVIGNGPKNTAYRVGIEIKKVGDVLTCMDDGRFAGVDGQLERMCRDYDSVWLVIEDELRPDPETGILMKRLPETFKRGRAAVVRGSERSRARTSTLRIPARWVPAQFGGKRTMMYADLMKWLIDVQVVSLVVYGKPLYVWRTTTREETARWVIAQYQWWQKKWTEHKALRVFNRSQWLAGEATGRGRRKGVAFVSPNRKKRAKLIASLDGVGYDKAMAIAAGFRSIRKMVNATADEYLTAGVVGKTLAKSICEQIDEEDKGGLR